MDCSGVVLPVIVIVVGTEGAGAVGVLPPDESPPPHAVTRGNSSKPNAAERLGENINHLR